jgi:hypothetical protein
MLSDPNGLTAGTMTRSSSPDRREERFVEVGRAGADVALDQAPFARRVNLNGGHHGKRVAVA